MRAEHTTALSLRGISRRRPGLLSLGTLVVCAGLGSGCASRQEPDRELLAQLRAMNERQVALERKVELLETRLAAASVSPRRGATSPAPATAPAPSSRGASSGLIPRDLATVRLAPPEAQRPRVETSVELKEPEEDVLAHLLAEPEEPQVDPGAPLEYQRAFESIRNGDVEHGADGLIRFADRYRRHELASQALFTAGVGLQAWGDPQGAILALERVVNDYPVAPEAPEAMLKLAECQRKLNRAASARETWAQLVNRYPQSAAAKSAASELKSAGVDGGEGSAPQ